MQREKTASTLRKKLSKRKELLKYERKVPHLVHDSQKLTTILSDYIDRNKLTNHTYLARLDDHHSVPANVAQEYSSALAFNKDFMNQL